MSDITLTTIFWHDYETWGANPTKDHPSQFAGIRTDLDLNVVGEPVMHYCQIPSDYLPHPQACLVTGITPQLTLRDGIPESEFMMKIHHEFLNICVVHNSIRFDDEVTRSFYRNFIDPYVWSANGNSRWDIIDLRACYALRPDGNRLRQRWRSKFAIRALTANDIHHADAHDAMSDVYATIGIAKLIKEKQPKLYQFVFGKRSKHAVNELIDCFNRTPLVHISSKLSAMQGCATWIVPICPHPTNKNSVIVLDLARDPTPLFELSLKCLRKSCITNPYANRRRVRLPSSKYI